MSTMIRYEDIFIKKMNTENIKKKLHSILFSDRNAVKLGYPASEILAFHIFRMANSFRFIIYYKYTIDQELECKV